MGKKLIIFPLSVMLLLILIAIAYGASHPADTVNLSGSAAGYLRYNMNGDGLNYWHDNATGHDYLVQYDTVGKGWGFYNSDTHEVWHSNSNGDVPGSTHSAGLTDIYNTDSIWIVITGAAFLAGAAGITILGSGLSDFSQQVIVSMAIWGVMWLTISYGASPIILSSEMGTFGTMLYFILTVMFGIGVGLDITNDGGD